jgi:hypothetical protein
MGYVFVVFKKAKSDNKNQSNDEFFPTKMVCVKFVKVLE